MNFLSVPSWDTLHPVIVHFPIALLLIAPIFIVIGAVLPKERGRFFLIAALLLILMGTLATFVARSTGEAAEKYAQKSSQINAVLEHHEEMAETTSIVFAVLSVIFAAVVLVPGLFRRPLNRLVYTGLPLSFLVLYSAGVVLLVNTAHDGGRLVHEFGVRANIQTAAPVTSKLHNGEHDN
jgi:uncharacterized membrane protein